MPHCPAEAARCSETDPAPAPTVALKIGTDFLLRFRRTVGFACGM
jgi:hypothetical protein